MEALVTPPLRPHRPSEWRGRRVLVTGHTGFKGAWLATWLVEMGAQVHGFALDPPTSPSLFELAGVAERLASDTRADVRDAEAVAGCARRVDPEIVFHLAAQSLVREGHVRPAATFDVNVMGTINVLEAVRPLRGARAIVVVTTDKCYENREWPHPYRETDRLGGRDPYSASKAAAEIAAACWRDSFGHAMSARIATARAGNVIGGGDWAADRLVPDCVRAFAAGQPVKLRNPGSVRPWQHVLDPLAGYLILARELAWPTRELAARAFNFGPGADGDATAHHVAEAVARCWGGGARVEVEPDPHAPHEAATLRLDATLARVQLDWQPAWTLEETVRLAVEGYRARGPALLDHMRAQFARHGDDT